MKKLPVCILLFLGLGLSCCQRPEEPALPAKLLPKDKVMSLMVQQHLLEARVEAARLTADSARALYIAQEKVLLRRWGTTDSAFKASFRYYAIHNNDLNDIYSAVIDSLTLRQAKLDKSAAVKK